MEIDCLLSLLLLFPHLDTQSISSEGREGKQHVDYADEKAIHQHCRWCCLINDLNSNTHSQLMSAVSHVLIEEYNFP